MVRRSLLLQCWCPGFDQFDDLLPVVVPHHVVVGLLQGGDTGQDVGGLPRQEDVPQRGGGLPRGGEGLPLPAGGQGAGVAVEDGALRGGLEEPQQGHPGEGLAALPAVGDIPPPVVQIPPARWCFSFFLADVVFTVADHNILDKVGLSSLRVYPNKLSIIRRTVHLNSL